MRPYISFLVKNKTLNIPVFRSYLLMRSAIIMSLNMQITIISYLVYKLTKDQLSLGIIGLAEVIPAVVFSLFSGHIVDNREKRNSLLQCIIAYLFLSAFFVLLATDWFRAQAGISLTVWLIYAGVFVSGAIRAFLSPSTFALLGLIIPKKHYANAGIWSSTSWHLGAVIGPLLGGFIIAINGFTSSLIAVFIIQAVSLAALLRIPKQAIHKTNKESIMKSLGEGLRFVFSTQAILVALSLDMFAVLFGGATALLPVYADDILKVGEVGFGWLRAAPAIGAIIMSGFLAFIPLKTKAGPKLLWCIMGFGASTILFGIATNFWVALIALLLGGAFDQISVVIRGTILQLYTPDNMRGRVAAVNTMFISSSNELGALESGITAKWMGTVPAVVFGGIMTFIVVIVTFFSAPILKTLSLKPKQDDKT
ncbi:MAG: MFS transporter [Bacteroidetes bacterium]|nr:MFS transporter [Bacteroidota bacterium]